ncbi:MAG TPA: AMP-binding protein, partial [Kofleriaceae bacterium]|nr:AMP-binding protein [Kofleriaceae bacterium]
MSISQPPRPGSSAPVHDREPGGHAAEPTLLALARSGVIHLPDAVAIVAPGHGGALSRDRLEAEVERAADALAALGISREDRVAVVLANGPEMALAFLAISGAAVCAPLNPSYRAAEFEFYLDDLRARALVLRAGDPSPAREVARARGISIIELHPTAGEPPGVFTLSGAPVGPAVSRLPPRGDDVALILHTSGTTARPKIVPIRHRNLHASARSVAAALRLGADDRCLNVMPLFHIHGLVAGILAPLASGGSVICPPGFVATEFFDWMAAFAPTWYTAVPTIHRGVLARSAMHPEVVATHRLRLIRSSSSPLSPDVMEALENTFHVPVIEAYGMTEAAHQMTCNPLPPAARKAGSVGVSAGAEVAILDEAGARLAAHVRGEICIRGPGVISGYHDNPEANATAFTDGWFRTGDEGYLDDDGYLFISGRIKEIINRAGEKVSPREVDEVLLQHPSVGEATCFGLPDPELGESVAAAVVLRAGRAATESELREFAAGHLALYKVPSRILIVEAIPKSSVGKPQRIGLYKKLGLVPRAIARTPGTDAAATWTAMERAVASIWTEVLRVPRVGLNDRFLDVGGDSVLASRAIARLRGLAAVDLPLMLFFDAPTVSAQAARITELQAGGRGPAEIPRVARGGDLPLSSVQESIWLADQIEGNGLSNLRSTNVRLRGALDADRLARAVAGLFER